MSKLAYANIKGFESRDGIVEEFKAANADPDAEFIL